MKRAVIGLVLALVASACGNSNQDAASSSSASPAASTAGKSSSSSLEGVVPINKGKDGTENVALAEAYAKDVCECKDAQCINKAGDKYHEATDKMYADKQLRTPTPEQKKQMDEAGARVKECTDKLLKKK